jgi:nucleoside-diphosphate-sugar epimerase
MVGVWAARPEGQESNSPRAIVTGRFSATVVVGVELLLRAVLAHCWSEHDGSGFKTARRAPYWRPDGTRRKWLDVSRLAKLGWRARTALGDGIKLAYQAYLTNSARARTHTDRHWRTSALLRIAD